MSQRSQVAKCICLCLCLCHCLFVGWVTCPHHSDRLLQRSQVSRIALWRLIISNSSYGLYLWLAGWNSLHCFPLSLFIAAREKGIFQSFPKSERSQSRTRSKFWSASPADETLSRLLWSNKPSLYEEQKMLSGRHPAGGKSRKIIFACKTWFQPNCHILGICPEVLNWCHLQLKGLQSQFSIYWEIWDLLNAVFLFSSSKSFLKMLHFCKVNKQICCIICTDNPIHIPSSKDCTSRRAIGRGRQIFSHIEVLAVLSDIGQTYQKLVTWLTFSI